MIGATAIPASFDPAGNRTKADAFYSSKVNDPNWKPCNYSSTGPPTAASSLAALLANDDETNGLP